MPRPRVRPFAYALPHVYQFLVFLAACGGGAINSVAGGSAVRYMVVSVGLAMAVSMFLRP
jgi:hypothetical protein